MFSLYKDQSVFLTGHTGFKGAWMHDAQGNVAAWETVAAAHARDLRVTVPALEHAQQVTIEANLLGDKELYMLAAKNSKPSYSQTGVIDPSGMKSVNDMLTQFDEEMKGTKVDIAKTFDDRFVKKAAETIK